ARHRRCGIWSDLHQIVTLLLRETEGLVRGHHAQLASVLIDDPELRHADHLVHAKVSTDGDSSKGEMDTLPIPGTTGGRQSPRDYSTRFSGGSTRADRPRAAGVAELRRGASPRIWEGDAAVSGPDGPRTLGPVLPASVHPRLLLVDDDPNLLVFLADRLRDDGFTVTTARNGREALRRLDEEWPDLLVVDLLMPEMDGLTLAGQVKERA